MRSSLGTFRGVYLSLRLDQELFSSGKVIFICDMSHSSVRFFSILNDNFFIRLTIDEKCNSVTTSKELFTLFNRNPEEFLSRFITMYIGRPEHTGEQAVVETMYFSGELALEVGLWTAKYIATVFLECTSYNPHRLPSK